MRELTPYSVAGIIRTLKKTGRLVLQGDPLGQHQVFLV